MSDIKIEEFKEENLSDALEIYNYYVSNSTATFHNHEQSLDEMREIIFSDNEKYKSFAVKEGEALAGYVLLKQFHKREAYDGTAEVTIYLKHGRTGKGLGKIALRYIEAFAKEKDLHALMAIICGENIESIKLFERNGYFKCAHYKEVGKKFGRILDVVTYEKLI